MEVMTDEIRSENFKTLSKMLYRTMRRKAVLNPGVFWQYEKVVPEFFGEGLPSFPWYEEQSKTNRENSFTPESEGGLDDQYDYTPYYVTGDMSRRSVGAAMNPQARDMIDRELHRENARLQQLPYSLQPHGNHGANAYDGYHPVFPHFRTQHTPQHNMQTYNRAYPNQHPETYQQGASVENRRQRKKRHRSPEHPRRHHKNHQDNTGRPQPSDNGHTKNSGERRYDSPSSDSSSSSSCSDSSSSSDTDDSDVEGENRIVFDPYDHQPWIVYNRKVHEKLSDNRMLLPGSSGQRVTAEVIYNPSNPNVFRTKQISDTNRLTPFLGATEAHNMIMRGFELRASDSVSPNKALRIIDSRPTPNSGLSQILELLKIHEPSIAKATRDDKEKDILQAFPDEAFDCISMINLNKGWPFLENDYIEWAKDRILSLDDFKEAIRFEGLDTSSCTSELLKKERESRKLVVLQFASTHLVELYSNKVGSLDDTTKSRNRISSEEGKAIAQTMLPVMKHLIVQWMQAKMAVRKALFYKNIILGNVSWILKSSMWDSSIFPKSAIDQLRHEVTNDVAEKLGYRVTGYGNTQQPPNKKMKHFQFQNQPGPSQVQRPKNSSNQNFRKQNFPKQNFREGQQKKNQSKKKKKWIKANKNFENSKGSKAKQNFNKNQKGNANNNDNKNNKKER